MNRSENATSIFSNWDEVFFLMIFQFFLITYGNFRFLYFHGNQEDYSCWLGDTFYENDSINYSNEIHLTKIKENLLICEHMYNTSFTKQILHQRWMANVYSFIFSLCPLHICIAFYSYLWVDEDGDFLWPQQSPFSSFDSDTMTNVDGASKMCDSIELFLNC